MSNDYQDSPHITGFIRANGLSLHYLDLGGANEPLLCLTGGGDSAHVFDGLAHQLAGRFRVLALTRRGHGSSECPETGYDIGTLADDIVAFLDVLQIQRVTLLGHSFGGSEISLLAVRHPERVARLIYLDAAFDHGEVMALARTRPVMASKPGPEHRASLDAYREWRRQLHGFWSPALEANLRSIVDVAPDGTVARRMPRRIVHALFRGLAEFHPEFTRIAAPALALYADDLGGDRLRATANPADRERLLQWMQDAREPFRRRQIARFRAEVPHAHVVEMADTHHYCFVQRETEVADIIQEWVAGT